MSKVTLTIDGIPYEVTERVYDLAESMFNDLISELKKINEDNPSVPGRLDGPAQRLTAQAQARYRQRLRDLVIDGIEPVANG